MKRRPVLLVLAAVGFFSWIGYLAYLALTASEPIVLSRPQFLISALDVGVEVHSLPDGRPVPHVKVLKTFWPHTQEAERLQGTSLDIQDLPSQKDDGWQGPGSYL